MKKLSLSALLALLACIDVRAKNLPIDDNNQPTVGRANHHELHLHANATQDLDDAISKQQQSSNVIGRNLDLQKQIPALLNSNVSEASNDSLVISNNSRPLSSTSIVDALLPRQPQKVETQPDREISAPNVQHRCLDDPRVQVQVSPDSQPVADVAAKQVPKIVPQSQPVIARQSALDSQPVVVETPVVVINQPQPPAESQPALPVQQPQPPVLLPQPLPVEQQQQQQQSLPVSQPVVQQLPLPAQPVQQQPQPVPLPVQQQPVQPVVIIPVQQPVEQPIPIQPVEQTPPGLQPQQLPIEQPLPLPLELQPQLVPQIQQPAPPLTPPLELQPQGQQPAAQLPGLQSQPQQLPVVVQVQPLPSSSLGSRVIEDQIVIVNQVQGLN